MKYCGLNKLYLIFSFFILHSLKAQNLRWTYIYPFGQSELASICNDVCVGNDGNIYGVGRAASGFGVIVSLTSDGIERWRFNGFDTISTTWEHLNSVIYATDQNLYAVGAREITATSYHYPVIISLTNSGSIRWIITMPQPCSTGIGFTSIVEGMYGDIYAIGEMNGDFAVVSFSKQGQILWTYNYDGGVSNYNEVAYSITQDEFGNLYVCGTSYHTGTGWDFTVISLTPSGQERWIYRYSTSNGDRANSITYDFNGNIYVCGYSNLTGSGNSSQFIVISLTTEGSERWVRTYQGFPGYSADRATSIICDNGNIYVCGRIYHPFGSYNSLAVINFDSNGNENWFFRYNGPGNSGGSASAITNYNGNIYVSSSENYFSVFNLNSNGELLWSYRLGGYRGAFKGYTTSIESDEYNNIYVGGRYNDSGFVIISLGTSVHKKEDKFFKKTCDILFSPLFFNNKIVVKFKEKNSVPLNLSIYNILGQKVFEGDYPFKEEIELKDKKISSLSKGIYFLKILQNKKEIGKFKIIKK